MRSQIPHLLSMALTYTCPDNFLTKELQVFTGVDLSRSLTELELKMPAIAVADATAQAIYSF